MSLDAIVAALLAAVPAEGRVLVAVDGVGASGKTTFAAQLAEQRPPRPVIVLHVDDFFHPSGVRHARGRYSAEGFWLDAYDYDALVAGALAPLAAGGSGATDPRRSTPPPTRPSSPTGGRAARRARRWSRGPSCTATSCCGSGTSLYLDVPFEEATRRMVLRRTGSIGRRTATSEVSASTSPPPRRGNARRSSSTPRIPASPGSWTPAAVGPDRRLSGVMAPTPRRPAAARLRPDGAPAVGRELGPFQRRRAVQEVRPPLVVHGQHGVRPERPAQLAPVRDRHRVAQRAGRGNRTPPRCTTTVPTCSRSATRRTSRSAPCRPSPTPRRAPGPPT